MKHSALSGLFALALVACSGGGDDPDGGGNTDLDVEPYGEAGPLAEGPTGRWTKRLTVDMLQASVPVVAGRGADGQPIRWKVDHKGGTRDGFAQNVFGGTLGKADYHRVTEENTVPSSLYAKLLDDVARNVCDQMLQADLAKTEASERVLTRFAGAGSDADVAANVRYLTLRFLGENLEPDAPQIIGLQKLYGEVAAAAKGAKDPAMEGWRAVCVALVSSPAFHVY